VWTGKINRNSDSAMTAPLRRRNSALFFVNSMSDFWHPNAADEWRHEAFDVMIATPQHQYQILTKRPDLIAPTLARMGRSLPVNVWLGATVEDARVSDRIDSLRSIPASIRFLSVEPLIADFGTPDLSGIDWVITGGESGPRCRPCKGQWVRTIRDHIAARHPSIALFHKQWGHYKSNPLVHELGLTEAEAEAIDPRTFGKGGAHLDGELWRQFPKYSPVASLVAL
jgi:protein gp37